MKNKVTIDKEHRLYVIGTERGYSHIGFDVLKRWATDLAVELGFMITNHRPGSMELYRTWECLCREGQKGNKDTGWRSTSQLEPALIGKEKCRVEVTAMDGERHRFIVGKSTGWLPIHLAIARKDSSGGVGVPPGPYKEVRLIEQVDRTTRRPRR